MELVSQRFGTDNFIYNYVKDKMNKINTDQNPTYVKNFKL